MSQSSQCLLDTAFVVLSYAPFSLFFRIFNQNIVLNTQDLRKLKLQKSQHKSGKMDKDIIPPLAEGLLALDSYC